MLKKGVSEIVSYVLLILIAIAISVLVFIFLNAFIPKAKPECKEGIELAIRGVACNSDTKELYLNLENRGLFTIDNVFIRIGESGKKYKALIADPNDLEKNMWPIALAPQKLTGPTKYSLPQEYGAASSSYIVEVQPVHITEDKKSFALCPTISQTVLCASGSKIVCPEPGGCKEPPPFTKPKPPELPKASPSPTPSPAAVCGNGIPEGTEECDNRDNNGKVCQASYDTSCSYCSSSCKFVNVLGPRCGDSIKNGNVDNGIFLRGDANSDGSVDISDPIYTLGNINKWKGDYTYRCPDAADSNDNGGMDINDVIFTLKWLFSEGSIPRAPGPFIPGTDPTADKLTCDGIIREQCDKSDGLTEGKVCNAKCKLVNAGAASPSPSPAAVCGNGIPEGTEECDNRDNNGKVCQAPYDTSCSYCSSSCKFVNAPGPRCGDRKINGNVNNNNFLRGDANSDGAVDISDPIYTLGNLNRWEAPHNYELKCPDAADSDNDEDVDINDVTYTLKWLFDDKEATSLPAPGPFTPGPDSSKPSISDKIGCGAAIVREECELNDGINEPAGYTCSSLCKLAEASAGSPSPTP